MARSTYTVRRSGYTSTKTTFFLFAVILSIPLVSLYIGYFIGSYFTEPRMHLSDSQVVVDHYMLNATRKNTHHVTLHLHGGLGNMLFQYASMYGIGRASHLLAVLPEDSYLSVTFTNLYAELGGSKLPGSQWAKFREVRPNMFDVKTFNLNFEKDILLEGFFQSWRYFEHVKESIQRQFTFTKSTVENVERFIWNSFEEVRRTSIFGESINPEEIQFVGLHVRRGDLLNPLSVDRGYTVATKSYILRAMDYFIDKYSNVIFIVCTDDLEWSKRNVRSLSHPVVFSPGASASFDLCLLSRCNHTITTVGSFGWWGAYLAGGETIYYKDFPRRGSEVDRFFSPSDYFYPHWIAM